MEVTGILMRRLGLREGVSQRNGQPWKIAEYLVEIPGQYPRHINFRVSDGQSGRIAHFDSLIGKTVTVSFDIDAHEYEDRWYNEINAWGVMEYVVGRRMPQTTYAPETSQEAPSDGGTGSAPSAAAPTTGTAPFPPSGQTKEGGDDDLPF